MSGHRLPARKRIALIAHDRKNEELLAWASLHRDALRVVGLWNIPVGSNVATADLLFSSPYLSGYASSIMLPPRVQAEA